MTVTHSKDVVGQKRAFMFLLNCGETTYADIPATQCWIISYGDKLLTQKCSTGWSVCCL